MKWALVCAAGAALDVLGLARAGQDQAEFALLDLGQQLGRALEGLDLADDLVELPHLTLAQVVPVRLLYIPAADVGHEQSPLIPMPRWVRHIGRVMP